MRRIVSLTNLDPLSIAFRKVDWTSFDGNYTVTSPTDGNLMHRDIRRTSLTHHPIPVHIFHGVSNK